MKFGKRLRQLRQEKQLTLRELENETGITFSALGKYEREERQPDFDTLEIIAEYFGVSIDWLLGRSEIRFYEEHIFIDDVTELADKISKASAEKRKIIVNAIDHLYLMINRHFDDEDSKNLKLIQEIIFQLFWFDSGTFLNSNEILNLKDPSDAIDFLSKHKAQFNLLLDELFKLQVEQLNKKNS